MMSQGTYYIGRVLKLGILNQEKLIDALKNPQIVYYRGNAWTFIDVEEYQDSDNTYIFGKLSKFSPDGEVTLVDTVTHSEIVQLEPNLRMASSPFIYIPGHSGIAFLHVYNHIEQRTFIKRFCEIVEKTHHNFFVDCDIELVSDLKTFSTKLSSLDSIYQISANISPPNPLFSPLWSSLEKYLKERNTDRMSITEDAPAANELHTNLPELVEDAANQDVDHIFIPDQPIPIGDAAILMAADGYGNGKVKGKRDKEIVIIKTSETAINFTFEKEPDSYEFYLKVLAIFKKIEKSRHMEHGE